jgi:hypothetical protein
MPDVALELAAVNELASLTGFDITNVRPGPDERGIDVLFEIEGRRVGAQHTTFHWDEGDIPSKRGSQAREAEERASRNKTLYPTWVKPDYRPALRRCVDKKIEKAAAHDNREMISETWLVVSVGIGRSPLSTFMLPDVLAADDLNGLCHAQLFASEFECACLVLHMNRIVWGWDRPGGWRVLADPNGAERRGRRKLMSDLIFNDIAADFEARIKRPHRENPAGRLPGGGISPPRAS